MKFLFAIAILLITLIVICSIRFIIERAVAQHYEKQYRKYIEECIEKQKK